jgi:hypothetical protein
LTMLTRKRRRSQVFHSNNADESQSSAPLQDNGMHVDNLAHSDKECLDDHLAKEHQMWQSVREEHFSGMPIFLLPFLSLCPIFPSQVIEQLPLTLQRQYALIHELDHQAQGVFAYNAITRSLTFLDQTI